jgi:hypothetical protein
MQIEVSKQSTEIVEVKTPSFYKEHNILFYAITDAGVITVSGDSVMTTNALSNKTNYQKTIARVINCEESNQEEFFEAYHQAQKNIANQFNAIQGNEG